MRAGLWPDDIIDEAHPDHKHSQPKWHYINYELRFPYDGAVKVVDGENILKAINVNQQQFRYGSNGDKARALCWLIHLVGDIHQQLHSVSLFSAHYPNGDRGGNDFWVSDKGTINLHAYWDGLMGRSTRYHEVLNETGILTSGKNSSSKGSELEPADWNLESFRLAREEVYRMGRLLGSKNKLQAPSLPANYGKDARKIAGKRILSAGNRLFKILST